MTAPVTARMTPATAFVLTDPLPQQSLALEASAGTGKTWTLTALALRWIAEGQAELGELLIVTFTRAATAELRDRVRARLDQGWRELDRALVAPATFRTDDNLLAQLVDEALHGAGSEELVRRRDRLQQAAASIDDATITTIHGFCQQMLHHAALEAGVDLDTVLLEDDAELLDEVTDDLLARELRPADADWVRYLRQVGKVDREQLGRLARAVAGLPELRLRPPPAPPDQPDLAPWDQARDRFAACWRQGGRDQALQLIDELRDDGLLTPRQKTFTPAGAAAAAAQVDAWLADPHRVPPGPVKRGRQPHKVARYPMSYFSAVALATKLAPGAQLPVRDVPQFADDLLDAAAVPATRFLGRMAADVWHELDRRKRQRTALSFDDLLRRLAHALQDPATRSATRAAIRARYRVALIDEFQDTDPVQWRIFDELFGPDEPVVLIGDPKQAIYGFRGADVHTYLAARDTRAERRTLPTNHRSDASYVRACNHLFGRPGAFGTPDIAYHRLQAAHGDRLVGDEAAPFTVRFVPRSAGEVARNHPRLLTKGWADRALPHDVAAVAVEVLTSAATLPDADGGSRRRELLPRDLAVLVRTNRRAEAVLRALRAAGIPAVIQRGGSVYATAEADAVQRLLTALLRPASERSAVSAAASLLFARDARTLVGQLESLGLDQQPGAGSGPGPGRGPAAGWDAWIASLQRWSSRWRHEGILPALQQAFVEDGVVARLLTTDGGERHVTNLRHLLELLHAAEQAEGLSPHALADHLQTRRFEAAEGDRPTVETELRLEEDAEAVRVVTIHGSKGLQYPVVLCPDLWDGADRTDQRLTRYHDPQAADPGTAITLDLEVDMDAPGKQRSLAIARGEARTEQLRLAYVALTRAQYRCVVWWGPFNDAPTSPLASLLHTRPDDEVSDDDPTAALAAAEQRVKDAEDEDLLEDLAALAAGSRGTIAVQQATTLGPGATWTPPVASPPELAARPFTRGRLDLSWRRTSFTALVRPADGPGPAGVEVGAGRDVDADGQSGAASVPDEPALDGPSVPLADFPRGAGPGTFLHDVLEHADLAAMDDDAVMHDLLEHLERRHGISPAHRSMVLTGLRAAATTPLGTVGGGARLADLTRRDRLDELRFELPLAKGRAAGPSVVTLRAIADRLAASADPLLVAYAPRLRDPALMGAVRGYLTGSIDLLARLPDGRFLVADYKSNWFGDATTGRSLAGHYRPAALAAAMVEHHYVLQALLYLVAAHRYLRWRLPGYDPDRHLAGGAYLFLRGMVGPAAELTGVLELPVDRALVADLSRLLDEGRP